ncbi:MAG: hypothetical protein ACJA1I_000457 [Zhongshania marina]|jgi:hypothetical protein
MTTEKCNRPQNAEKLSRNKLIASLSLEGRRILTECAKKIIAERGE